MSFVKKKSYGQHFLHEQGVVERIAGLLNPASVIVEVGPGGGILTKVLAKKEPERLILIEADTDLLDDLHTAFPQAEIIHADAAKVNVAEIVKDQDWVCVGNLPYNASAAIIVHMIRRTPRPFQCVFMIQREQAERICAGVGEMGILSLAVQLYGEVERAFPVGKGAFSPPPKVESTVIQITPYQDADEEVIEGILSLARHGFQHRRKQLYRSLVRAGYDEQKLKGTWQQLGLPADIRPQDISVETWCKLHAAVA